jgi:hypothetical protein
MRGSGPLTGETAEDTSSTQTVMSTKESSSVARLTAMGTTDGLSLAKYMMESGSEESDTAMVSGSEPIETLTLAFTILM